jgi:hypothetical protein
MLVMANLDTEQIRKLLLFLSKPDTLLLDHYGRLIEAGKYDELAELFLVDELAQERLTGAATHLPGAGTRTGLPGDVKIPNYTLKSPSNLKILENSMTVKDPILLSDLIRPNSGHSEWAACTEFPKMR